MKELMQHRGVLVAYVQPPGVVWVNNEGSSALHEIYNGRPDTFRFAVIKHSCKYEVMDFWEMTLSAEGWLIPSPSLAYDDPDAAVVATVLLNHK